MYQFIFKILLNYYILLINWGVLFLSFIVLRIFDKYMYELIFISKFHRKFDKVYNLLDT